MAGRVSPGKGRAAKDKPGASKGDKLCQQIWITWCDQVGIQDITAQTMRHLFSQNADPCLILPTIEKPNPYIHMQRNAKGEIVQVLQKREGDRMPSVGENDCGPRWYC